MVQTQKQKNINVLKNKIKFISKMAKMNKILRSENESIIKIKSMHGDKLPKGLLMEGKDAINSFQDFKERDRLNESRPAYD